MSKVNWNLFLVFVMSVVFCNCATNKEGARKTLVNEFEKGSFEGNIVRLKELREDPKGWVPILISGLQTVNCDEVSSGQLMNSKRIAGIVWRLRALEYLTGKRFSAGTNDKAFLGNSDSPRYDLLSGDKGKDFAFYAEWPSRGMLFFSPKDVQLEIINKWSNWEKTELDGFKFNPAADPRESIDDWYFGGIK